MNASLAIYDALIQAKVSPEAAKAVVDALDRDMNTWLATKQDFRHHAEVMNARFDSLGERLDSLERLTDLKLQSLEHNVDLKLQTFEHRIDLKLQGLEDRVDLKLQGLEGRLNLGSRNLESRLTIKLGALMTGLIGAWAALEAVLR